MERGLRSERDHAITRVCVAGATGWVGSVLVPAIAASDDLELGSAVARSVAGQDIGTVLGGEPLGVIVAGSVVDALDGVDVLVDYTSHDAVKASVAVVIGSSGLGADDFAEIESAAQTAGAGVIAAGNFSITAAMAQAAALLVAPHLPHAEIIDFASAGKADAPSGTARELAERLADVRSTIVERPVEDTKGSVEARGAGVGGTQVHSLRLPSFSVSTEIVFGMPDERLSIRHDAGSSAEPYVAGTLLAIRRVRDVVGLVRGLDTLLLGRTGG
ncbi:MAG: 4-hydroxy-tetrahydrodipicolinate reductase [Chloroflexi bacterium]|nr:4-hydroxy-tetrahydrodipicolinate reductase [Chloroflexota bacterium]